MLNGKDEIYVGIPYRADFLLDRRTLREMDGLLEKEGIERDRNLDYSAGLFDDSGRLVATGSCFKNTLRCMAVDSAHQGEGLMNEIVSHLIDVQYRRGNMELFLYTKCSTAKFFSDLGFYEIARVQDRVVFMENRRDGFSGYLERLKRETAAFSGTPGPEAGDGAVILNANPFTLGHQYLVETAQPPAAACCTCLSSLRTLPWCLSRSARNWLWKDARTCPTWCFTRPAAI